MTRKEFELHDFNKAVDFMADVNPYILPFATLESSARYYKRNGETKLATHIENAIKDRSNWYYYDICAGATKTPVCLRNADDVEKYIGFDKE